ncbi:MAG: VanW family protein [Clostridiales bacterium]|nr:VanW family protein [Clostridiales bacterium]
MRYKLLSLLLLLVTLSCCAAADTGTAICLEDFLASADSNGRPRILYTGQTSVSLTKRSEPDAESASLGTLKVKETVQIFGFDQTWLFCWDDAAGIYYIKRANVVDIVPVAGNDVPYGVIPNRFVAVTACDTTLYASPDPGSEALDSYPADTRMSVWMIQDGWAVVPYKRLVGYIYVGDLKELTPVAPSVEYAQDGDIIAAFTTFYSLKQTELNIGRMENIRVGCMYISHSYEPGEEFDFNAIAGPYRASRGYKPSPVLVDGGTVAGSGGGTCQVSTTLYNALLQLYDGITILYRHAHGPGGASYAPHGVDAAVGRSGDAGVIELNLEFRNDFDFPITIDSTVQNGSLCICIRKGRVSE